MTDLGLDTPLDMDLEEIPEPEAVSAGEYDLLITDVLYGISQSSGNPMYTIVMDIVSEANAKTVKHYLPLPPSDADQSTKNNAYLNVKRFAEAVGLPLQGTVIADAKGMNVTAVLSEEEFQGRKQNKVRYFMKPGV